MYTWATYLRCNSDAMVHNILNKIPQANVPNNTLSTLITGGAIGLHHLKILEHCALENTISPCCPVIHPAKSTKIQSIFPGLIHLLRRRQRSTIIFTYWLRVAPLDLGVCVVVWVMIFDVTYDWKRGVKFKTSLYLIK